LGACAAHQRQYCDHGNGNFHGGSLSRVGRAPVRNCRLQSGRDRTCSHLCLFVQDGGQRVISSGAAQARSIRAA
jgi:hypothetical protein